MKNLIFNAIGSNGDTKVFDVIFKPNRILLGKIYWYEPWNQYVFESNRSMGFILGVNDIQELYEFIRELKLIQKTGVVSIDPYNGKVLGIKKKK